METNPTASYIVPSLRAFKSLDHLLGAPPENAEYPIKSVIRESIDSPTVVSLSEEKVGAFIIADPGYGKSALLRQVVKRGNEIERKAKIIDLKEITPKDIPDLYQKDTIIYCFDALDEVRYDYYDVIIVALHRFVQDHPDVSILISCRRHDAANNRAKFYQFSEFKFIGITPFDYDMIRQYIQEVGIEDEDVIQTLYSRARPIRDKISILSIPRYLEAVVGLIRKQLVTIEQIKNWKRKDFFEHFIYTRLEEAEKIKEGAEGYLRKNEKEITKRVLEKLALVMEIYQVNRISKDEFITFLDGIQSNVNLVFLNICDIDTFFKRVLETRVEQGVEYLEFNNTEFQEYLAAKELARVAGNPQAIYDLVMEPQFGNIYSNWYDVLRYLVEIRPEVILSIVEHLNQKSGQWVESEYWDLLSGVNPEEMAAQERAKIFEYAFTYLQNHTGAFIISPRVDFVQFYVSANYPLVREPILPTDKESERLLFIQIDIIKMLIVKDLLEGAEKGKWQQLLIDLALQDKYEIIQKNSIIALTHFGDLELLKDIKQVFKSANFEIRQTFVQACFKVNPNSDFSVGIFLKSLSEKRDYFAADGINSITEPSQLLKVLKAFEANKELFAEYLKQSMSYASHIRWKIIENLRSNWDASFEKPLTAMLKNLLEISFSPISGKEQFTHKMIELLGQQNETFIYQLVDISDIHLIYRHHRTVRKILTVEHTTSFVERFLENNPGSRFALALRIFHPLYSLKEDHPELNRIYEAGRAFLADQYERWESLPEGSSGSQWKEDQEHEIFSEFSRMLASDHENFEREMYTHFLTNEATIRKYATPEDFERLKIKLSNSIDRIKPGTTLVEIEQRSAFKVKYKLNADLQNAELFLSLAEVLGMSESIALSRKTLLELLPLHPEQDPRETPNSRVVKLLGEISATDEVYLYEFVAARDDDYLRISPVGFAQIIKFFDLKKLVPILQAMVDDEGLIDNERVQIFSILANSFPEQNFLLDAFSSYENATCNNLQKIGYLANEALITAFKNEKAIQWRIEQLKGAIRPIEPLKASLTDPRWDHPVFDLRGSLSYLATPLIALQDEQYVPYFNDLLAFAFEKLAEQIEYLSHCDFLFQTVMGFFLGLREKSNGYGVLQDLFQFLDQQQFKEVKHFFGKYKLQLEVEYAKLYDKPRSIQFAINRYNQVKAKSYLPIYHSRDLLLLIQEVINEDIRRFVYEEGFYSVLEYLTNPKDKTSKKGRVTRKAYPNEDHIQKVLAVQLENALLKKGLRETDIYREPQLMDDKRIDLLIKYGFVKPIVIELKLLHNQEITSPAKRKPYKEKLATYLRSQNADFGIYLIFKVKEDRANKDEKQFHKLRKEYKDIRGLEIPDFIDCTVNTISR